MVTRDELAQLVKDALANLYNPVRLQSHHLGQLLALQRLDGETDAETLRRYLRESIDRLRPPADTPQDSSAWLAHQVLLLHYVRCLETPEVCRDLSISPATFYRRQREAIGALVDVVLHDVRQRGGHAADRPADGPSDVRKRAINLASQMPSRSIDTSDLAQSVVETIKPLADRQGVLLQAKIAPDLPPVWGDEAMLRQAMLALLSECVVRAGVPRINLSIRRVRNDIRGAICMPYANKRTLSELVESQPVRTGSELLQVYGGRTWLDSTDPSRPCMSFVLAVREPETVVIVDDDQDTVDLYRRYLRQGNYSVRSANTANQVDEVLTEVKPDVVLLDVLIPRQDGWTILNRLRSHDATQSVPVIVCSVLEQPELAIALGANRVLIKPISEEQLLAAVRQVLHQANSPASPRPATP